MGKQKKQFILLLVLVLLLAAAFLGIRQYNKVQEEKPEETEGEVIIDAQAEDVVKIDFDYEGEEITLEKVDDVWYNSQDHSQAIKQNRPGVILKKVTPLVAEQVIDNVTDLSQYGLTQPSRVISFETAAESYIIYVGDTNEVTGACYISFPSDTKVYVVDKDTFTFFNADWASLIDTSEESSAEESIAEESSAGESTAEESSAEESTAEESSSPAETGTKESAPN